MKRNDLPDKLRWQFWGLALVAACSFAVLLLILKGVTSPFLLWQRVFLSSAGFLFVLFFTFSHLHKNHPSHSKYIFSDFGAANMLSIIRGLLAAALLFFMGLPRPPGWQRWLPGIIFLVLALTDSVDGRVARRNNRLTVLGNKLDLTFDIFAALVAILLLMGYGQVPVWFIIAGLMPIFFSTWMAWRIRFGKTVHTLPPSRLRPLVGGFLFGFLCFAMAPIFPAHITTVVAALLMAALCYSFGRDALYVTGRLERLRRLQATKLNRQKTPLEPG